MRKIFVAMILFVMSAGDLAAQQINWGAISARLEPNMTEQQVIKAVGYSPNKVELQTCGTQSPGGPWQCKIYTFGNLFYNLRVTFEQLPRGAWVVNSWDVYP